MRATRTLCAFLWFTFSASGAEEIIGGPEYQGLDERTGVIRNGVWRSGMPLGGIGCGKFELLPACWFGRFTLNHNWDLPLWEEPFVPSRGTFFAISVRDGPRRITRWLRRGWPEEELKDVEQVRSVEFRGMFPFADVNFVDPKLPVRVRLHAWSPLIPHNIKDSSLPVAFFDLVVENPLDRAVEVSAMMSLENFIGIGGVRVHDGKQRWYFADGSSQQPVVLTRTVLQGLRLVTPRKFEGIGKNVAGEYLLLSDGPTTDRGWNALGDGSELVEDLLNDGELNGLMVKAREDKVRPAGALCRKFRLNPYEQQTLRFVVAWWMPSHVTLDLKDHGHFYLRSFKDSEKLCEYALAERERLERETGEWGRLVREANVPEWMKRLVLNSASTLFSNTMLTRDGEFATLENPGRGEGALGALEQRWAGNAVSRAFFPELDRSELELFRGCQQSSGELARLCGNIYRGIGNTNVWNAATGRAEPTCVYITQVLDHFRGTGDRKFLDDCWPGVRRALDWLNTNKGNWTVITASLFESAQRAAADIARVEGDTAAARACEDHAADAQLLLFRFPALPKDADALLSALLLPDPFQLPPFAAARPIYDAAYRYNKSPWGSPTTFSLSLNDAPVTSESHLRGAGPWSLLSRLANAELDAPNHRLLIAPVVPDGMSELHVPLFFPSCWAWLDFGPQQFRLRVVKQFGEPLELRELAAGAGAKVVALPQPFRAVAGATLDLSPWRGLLTASRSTATPKTKSPSLHWSRDGVGTLLWSASASSEEPFFPGDAFDGFRETRWQTIGSARTSDWFKLDLGEKRELRHLEMDTPPGLRFNVGGSVDGAQWQSLGIANATATGLARLEFASHVLRWVRVVPAADGAQPWRLYEIRVK